MVRWCAGALVRLVSHRVLLAKKFAGVLIFFVSLQ